jgi:two-component system, NarL family, response regulator NreC
MGRVMTIKVVLADDHPIVRQGLRNLLNSELDFKVIGEASDGLKALELVDTLRPDVLVVDLMMPVLNGMEVIRRAKHSAPGLRIIVLSMQNADAYVVEALKSGAAGYVLKDTGPAELIQAIREVVAGQRYLSPEIAGRLTNPYVQQSGESIDDPYKRLSNREREVLQLAAEGYTSADIAARLFISPRTAELHRSNVLSKLSLHSQNDLVRYALKRGILSLDT